MVKLYLGFLVVLALERGVEVAISRRHAAWAFSHGGVEFGEGHFIYIKLLHTVFFFACGGEVLLLHRPFLPELGVPMLGLAVAAQCLRYWAIATLGKHWNVRVIVIPGEPAVSAGPYRYLRHPNYLAVIVEGIAVPLIHTAWITAIAFAVLNAAILWVRIRCEETALATHARYQERLGHRPRFIPRPRARMEG
ncbi:MAG: isoprenylcysteine carboxyl methyltransferase family protein [Acidobacteriota bacterium]